MCVMIFVDPSDTELGWKILGCGTVVRLLCATYIYLFLLFSPTATLALVAYIGRNNIAAFAVDE